MKAFATAIDFCSLFVLIFPAAGRAYGADLAQL
jgi:hypothetical protein